LDDKKPTLHAVFETTEGKFTCALFPDKAPKTIENFVALAKGTKQFKDPKSGQPAQRPFYDGLIFHRVMPNFMIQGGCPLSTGTGGPGYQFEDEFTDDLTFDRVGRLAMANAGPNSNGSQFFITVAPTPWLNNHHTIFGQVTEGQDVVTKISLVTRDRRDKPLKPVVIQSIKIVEG
jgi:peptidyl-prolyl cis-trans isomerase A (cyclophilin A)